MLLQLFYILNFFTLGIADPTTVINGSTFLGIRSETKYGPVDRFFGIPFALSPNGTRRFRLPIPITYAQNSTYDVRHSGPICPQQFPLSLPYPRNPIAAAIERLIGDALRDTRPESEDCLSLNIVVPAAAVTERKLPVVVWFTGGAFEFYGPPLRDRGQRIVTRSLQMRKPIIYVGINYRVSMFGFLPGKQVKAQKVGNLGLYDQVEGLRWVHRYIEYFGGDPSKVTLWGESAGAISISIMMLMNKGNPNGFFRGAFMESGAPIPVGDITHGQRYYDAIVREVGCQRSFNSLNCLRQVDYEHIRAAMLASPALLSYQSLDLAWLPRTDGILIPEDQQKLVAQGLIANIPIVTGNCDDEGTAFALPSLNITTSEGLRKYIQMIFPTLEEAKIDRVLELYPEDPALGSPYDTKLRYVLSPQFKRIASLFGDEIFQAPRRHFLNHLHPGQPAWVYLSKRFKGLPFLGSAHTTDLMSVYAGELGEYLVNFVNDLDPNGTPGTNSSSLFFWPRWDPIKRQNIEFLDNRRKRIVIGHDTYREEAMQFLSNISLEHGV